MNKAIINKGNLNRLKNFFNRAEMGEDLTIGYLGGSITQGASATDDKLCYAYRTFSYIQNRFPKSHFTYVNAGIGSTTSEYGVSRVEEDLLVYHPDLIFVEYSVNDHNTIHFQETYEGLIRKILSSKWNPAVCLIHNMRYDDGKSAEVIHAAVGRHYELPSISLKALLLSDIRSGHIDWHTLSADGLHPNDKGHEILADMIIASLEELRTIDEDTPTNSVHSRDLSVNLPKPLTANRFENSLRIQNTSKYVQLEGFTADLTAQNGVRDCFKHGWFAWDEGAALHFSADCKNIAVIYRKTIQHPAQIAEAVIDGDFEHPIILDANFHETWGDLICLETLLDAEDHVGEGSKTHTVDITIKTAPQESPLPFYVVAFVIA